MELFLNLLWMMLLLPAFWLWRRGERERAAHRVTALQCLLTLGCAVVLLFPVISATDDLHAMRAEMEESATSKRAVRQAASARTLNGIHRLQGPPALVASAVTFPPLSSNQFEFFSALNVPAIPQRPLHRGRAPPSLSSFLA